MSRTMRAVASTVQSGDARGGATDSGQHQGRRGEKPAGAAQEKQKEESARKEKFAATLLAFESDVRQIDSVEELLAHLCNNTRAFLQFRQSFFCRRVGHSDRFKVTVVSSHASVDREAPFIRWIEKLASRVHQSADEAVQQCFTMPAHCDVHDEETHTYPFPEMLWTPVKDGDETVGGFLTCREHPWDDSARALTSRLADLYAHSWQATRGRSKLLLNPVITRKRGIIASLVLLLAAFIPVPITALAPAAVVARDPFIVASHIEGVVDEILVDQGQFIEKGQVLVTFDDVQLQNELLISERREAVADARYQQASRSAIASYETKRELAIAKAEYELARAESQYARELLDKTRLRAEQSGIAVYSDKRDWVGQPVSAGEAIMQIADPQKIRFAIDLPVSESLVLKENARVKLFLDSDPLSPVEATLKNASYQANADKRDVMSYSLNAVLHEEQDAGNTDIPRIGVHGTAQIYSDHAPLGYVLLRRPIAALRQYTGF